MRNLRTRKLAVVLAIAALAVPFGAGLAKELGMLIVSGPGIKGELRIEDPKALMDLEGSNFFDFGSVTNAPKGLGEGYTLVRYFRTEKGDEVVPIDKMVYYPDPAGGRGYLHVLSSLEADAKSAYGAWYRLRPGSEKAFLGLLQVYGVALPTTFKADEPAPAPAAPLEAVEPVPVEAAAPPAADPGLVPQATPDRSGWLVWGAASGLLALALAYGAWRWILRIQERREAGAVAVNK